MHNGKQNKFRSYPGLGGGQSRPDRKEQRRAEAIERNQAWEALSPKAKLASLKRRPGESSKQVSRILAGMP